MNREQAYETVRETFTQAFDKQRFKGFCLNLLNSLDESKAFMRNVTYIKEAFRSHVHTFERLGTYTSPRDETLDVLVVRLTDDSKLERARTAIRNFIADHLKLRDDKDAALVAFVSPSEKQWRFSYIRMDYATVEKPSGKVAIETRLTPAKRFSYIVGEGESCHTAQTRFLSLLQDTAKNPTLADIEAAFSVEAVTKEFFKQYAAKFEMIRAALDGLLERDQVLHNEFAAKHVNSVDFAKKLLGQIIFLYFLQKKGWLGVAKGRDWGTGPHDFLRRIANGKYANFFNDVLEPLFYDTLATDRGHEAWCERFGCRIPFLNGGLFEPLGDYDWKHVDVLLPNTLFTNDDFVEEGVTGTGILDLFDRYNFTVNEAQPLEKDVAIDPEMLGKVFENLIEENRRKGLGAYYTPREIVHYMCQESLINYLDAALNPCEQPIEPPTPQREKLFGVLAPEETALVTSSRTENVPHSDIETFVRLGEQISHYEAVATEYNISMPKSIVQHARQIDDILAGITVCDPAVGSGAYPVGMMTEIVRARLSLTPYFNDFHERTPYQFKRQAIQSCLYGVDIDPGAVEIARLRLWLSLVVDEEEVKQIRPLPNLDYRIVAGNSLLGFRFKSEGLSEIEKLKQKLFDETDHDRKAAMKTEVDRLLSERFAASKQVLGYEVNFDFEQVFSEVFHRKGGFDIVIANPPYVRIQEIDAAFAATLKRHFKAATGKFDIYVCFLEKGLSLTSPNGCMCYINPNRFLTSDYGKGIRALLSERKSLVQIVDFGASQNFETATTYTCVVLVGRREQAKAQYARVGSPQEFRALASTRVGFHEVPQPSTSGSWIFAGVRGGCLIERLSQLPNLESVCDEIFQGLISGGDKVFFLKLQSREKGTVVAESQINEKQYELEEDLCYDLLKGSEIKRYQPLSARYVAIFPYRVDEGNRTTLIAENELQRSFPKVFSYLNEFKPKLRDRGSPNMEYENWYAMWCPRSLAKFRATKVVTQVLASSASYTLDETGRTLFVGGGNAGGYGIIPSRGISAKLLLGLLNSRLLDFVLRNTSTVFQGGFYSYGRRFIGKLPVCNVPKTEQEGIEHWVEKILARKRYDPDVDTSAWEQEIDRVVYELYGLSDEEIAVVEGG
ncbi:MAG TPA: Eco57I restriction-modification methylase domain-containing protein [Candidatus Latescibacteria bacterium]|nr:Eco57I restriction-modification methylase domain-containing protein [Candidatus Latescibacterota bacterium]HPK75650.1 Eco57I restriction-modification methylase domain-containing protein [Candidatus Latescibacterota bacterium]